MKKARKAPVRLSRRAWLATTTVTGLALPRLSGAAVPAEVRGTEQLAPDEQTLSTLEAAAERVLPGVADAGFSDFAAYWLAREPFSRAPDWWPLLEAGAVHLDRVAQQRHGGKFAGLTPEQQDAILDSFQKGRVQARRFRSAVFFQRLVMLALEAFLGDPAYGGNRGGVGFAFIGREHHCWWAPRRLELGEDGGPARGDRPGED